MVKRQERSGRGEKGVETERTEGRRAKGLQEKDKENRGWPPPKLAHLGWGFVILSLRSSCAAGVWGAVCDGVVLDCSSTSEEGRMTGRHMLH